MISPLRAARLGLRRRRVALAWDPPRARKGAIVARTLGPRRRRGSAPRPKLRRCAAQGIVAAVVVLRCAQAAIRDPSGRFALRELRFSFTSYRFVFVEEPPRDPRGPQADEHLCLHPDDHGKTP